jgi:type III secretory pathway component EscU
VHSACQNGLICARFLRFVMIRCSFAYVVSALDDYVVRRESKQLRTHHVSDSSDGSKVEEVMERGKSSVCITWNCALRPIQP